jgi:hypothetical protein
MVARGLKFIVAGYLISKLPLLKVFIGHSPASRKKLNS